MALFGQLTTMSLMDLLQWAGLNRKSGVFELERDKVTKKLFFRDGRVVACYSDDPNSRLGQLLLSRGKITTDQLRDALQVQQATGDSIGNILKQRGLISSEELTELLSQKAEEIVLSLFDWQEAIFRFLEDGQLGPYVIELDLSVDDILLKGLQRVDELGIIRQVFPSSGVVLGRTGKALPPEIDKSGMARRIVESVDGQRTLAAILLHTNASDFLVLKFLYNLYNRGVVQIDDIRDAHEAMVTIVDPWRSSDDFSPPTPARGTGHWGAVPQAVADDGPKPTSAGHADIFGSDLDGSLEMTDPKTADPVVYEAEESDELQIEIPPDAQIDSIDAQLDADLDAAYGFDSPAPAGEASAPQETAADESMNWDDEPTPPEKNGADDDRAEAAREAVRALAIEMEETLTIVPWSEKRRRVEREDNEAASTVSDVNAGLQSAREALSTGEFGRALDLLDKSYREHPDDAHVKSLMEEAESAYTAHVTAGPLALDGVPVVVSDTAERVADELPPQSAYLLSMVDGVTEIRSMFWLAPMREVEVLRILDRLVAMGVLEVQRGPVPAE